jgi:uncharacterized protein (DUF2235 family)
MALYAFDGTGNEDRPGDERDSNVLHFFNAYQDPLKNADPKAARGSLYIEGIGTRAHTPIGDVLAKAFGLAAHDRLREARRRLDRNIAAGDTAVDIVGFSRGAALAVDFANQVCRQVPRADVRFLGVWDVVAQFGLPGEHVNLGFDLDCPDVVAYHAMALDENRAFFPLTRLARTGRVFDKLREVWFRGVHSDVGGGNGNRGLNWIALHWMFAAAVRHGLPIDPAAVAANLAFGDLPRAIRAHEVAIGPHRRLAAGDVVHLTVELTDADRRRLLGDPPLALSVVDDTGALSPLQPAGHGANA